MRIFHYKEAREEGALKLKVRWLITKDMGAENFAMRLFEMEPGGCSPLHSHPWEHEVFVLEGEGVVIGVEGEKRLKAGYVVFVPPSERHQFRNDGDKPLKFLCLVPHHPTPK